MYRTHTSLVRIALLLPGHIAPERLCLEARWASLVPYAAAADLLAERAEAELGDERVSFIEGCAAEWQELPIPEGRIIVGIDGGYVRDWTEKKTNFEIIVARPAWPITARSRPTKRRPDRPTDPDALWQDQPVTILAPA